MPRQTAGLWAFNRGEVSQQALARVDVERLRLAAEIQENMCPRTIGPMSFRPGLGFIAEVDQSKPAKLIEFQFATSDTAILELTDGQARVMVNDAFIVRPAVATALPALATWAQTVSTGSTIAVSGAGFTISNVLQNLNSKLTGTIDVGPADQAVEHAVRIVVTKGPITFRIGSAEGKDDVVATASLAEGVHSLAFTPNAATVYAQFESADYASRVVSSVTLESAAALALPTPWPEAQLRNVRWAQSADVIFACGGGVPQRRIERRGARSWSIVKYQSPDGPFAAVDQDGATLVATDACIGDATLTATQPYWKPEHVGALIRLFHQGQYTTRSLAAPNTFTDVVRVSGVSKVQETSGTTTVVRMTTDRNITVDISGTWSGTVTLYRSSDGADVGFTPYMTWTANTTGQVIVDNRDNVIVWYKLGFSATGYTSGVAQCSITHAGGGGKGVARIYQINSETEAKAEVLDPFANVSKATGFRISQWSDLAGWPTCVALHEGRLWFAGNSRIWGSVSDNYMSFDLDKEGDAGPIQRSIGQGPVANVNWMLSLNRLQLGCDSAIPSARSSTFDEPLTPNVFMLKTAISLGAAPIQGVKIDTRGQFVDSSKRRAYDLKFNVQINDYDVEDVTRLNPDISGAAGSGGFLAMAVQRQPDTRIHYVRADGQVAILLFDATDNVAGWWRLTTDGAVEDVIVLPGVVEDRVYYVVRRTIAGVTKRYIERLAMLHECTGGALNMNVDSYGVYDGPATQILSGLDYLEGKEVMVWADGRDASLVDGLDGGYIVVGGKIGLGHAVSQAVVGLPYKGRFKSAKLAYAAREGTAINQKKKADHVGFQLIDTHCQGLKFGKDFGALDPLPQVEDGAVVDPHTVHAAYDKIEIEFPGVTETDPRVCLECASPRPATIAGVTIDMVTQG